MAVAEQFFHFLKAKVSGVFIAYFLFAGYIIFDTITIALIPESGRIASFDCRQGISNETICTVAIYGFRGIARQTFLANRFSEAYESVAHVGEGTDAHTCGILINPGGPRQPNITFALANQECGDPRLSQTVEEINRRLRAIPQGSTQKIFYNGINRGLPQYLLVRIVLLTGSWCAVLVLNELSNLIKSRRRVASSFGGQTFAGTMFSWWGSNLLVRLFFYLYILVTFLYVYWILDTAPQWQADLEAGSFLNGCFALEKFRRSPASLLFGMHPFIGFATLQAFVQWRYLKRRVLLSAWWVATPVLVILSLATLFGSFMTVARNDCFAFKFIFSGVYYPILGYSGSIFIGKHALILLSAYFFLLGCVQWFLLRGRLKFAWMWIFVPSFNALTLFVLGWLTYLRGGFMGLLLPGSHVIIVLQVIALLLVLLIMQDILSAVFLATILSPNRVDRQQVISAGAV